MQLSCGFLAVSSMAASVQPLGSGSASLSSGKGLKALGAGGILEFLLCVGQGVSC